MSILVLLIASLLASPLVAKEVHAEDADQAPARKFPCAEDPRHHAFDFWIGEWTVTVDGKYAGTNNIQPILGHCTLFEQWQGVGGFEGKSFNYYDPANDNWRQLWISDSGTFIEFSGEARDGGMYFTATTTDANTVDASNGTITLHKFEFTQPEEGIVRQHWRVSTDDGDTWKVIWDGRYEPKK